MQLSSLPAGSYFSAVGYNSSDFPTLTRTPSSNPTDVYLSGGDIVSGSGFTLQLGVSMPATGDFAATFTPQSVPEPGTLSLVAIAALIGLRARRRRAACESC